MKKSPVRAESALRNLIGSYIFLLLSASDVIGLKPMHFSFKKTTLRNVLQFEPNRLYAI